ncbi:hypothetical protein [Cryptosporidium parvum Iowa II]|uniref:Uncharacterized protein n=2 Tax=Cryptosporidium parvum TaxID=5807 RepID=Q5CUF8_CRYPI|nr:hypothetical protein [Cryptosporidium parvum Iowa II]EAK89032.1 hypothetical protein with signal peptide and 7 transmembrane domains [Cryptosporidium parvum Iowa II]QOY42653.1 Uncharacterized protein CPATCC_0034010 [Cryptosporidium parvum]WKS77046.1 putative signal peptide-containing protein [Cryptosporidium sp. 43IA8]WRK31538.1 Uncharacterized protein cpbgf_3002990 [Cryptosporidium parvum]|eukprot:QOY42653.1 hypothetical protein CPATCC_001311 [Cryptosporidium parvum]
MSVKYCITSIFCICIYLFGKVEASLTDIPWSVSTPYILSSLEKAQQVINYSRVSTLEEFVSENCGRYDKLQESDLAYKKEMWESFKSWHSDYSVLAGIIFENAIIADSNKTHINLKPLISSYLDALIWREIASCIIFGISIFTFIAVSLGFVLCRVMNDRVVSFEETSNGLWKVKLSIYILSTLLCGLCVIYITLSIVIIVNFFAFSDSFLTSVCWFAIGADAFSNGNININTTSGSFSIAKSFLKTNTTVPFIGSLPLYGLFQELGSVETLIEFFKDTINYIRSAGFPTALSIRLNELANVFTNSSVINPNGIDWYIPAKELLKNSVLNAVNSFMPVNETLFNSMIPVLNKITDIIKSVDTSSMSFSVNEYFEIFKKFISYILLFLNVSRTASNIVFVIITVLCVSSTIIGVISIIFSILHIKLFLSGRSHIGFFQSRSALVAVAFIFMGLSTFVSFVSYTLTVSGTVGKDYCGWIVSDLFSPIGMNWISTVSPELGMIMSICMYPLASYIKIKSDNKRYLNEKDFITDRIRVLEYHGIKNHIYLDLFNKLQSDESKDSENIKDIFFNYSNKSPRFLLNQNHLFSNESLKSELYLGDLSTKSRAMNKNDFISNLFLNYNNELLKSNSNDILLAERFGNQEIVGLLDDAPIESSLSYLLVQLLPGSFVNDMSKIVPEYINIISTSQAIAEQCFNYMNITDYIKYSLMYFPDVEKSTPDEQDVPVLVLITQSYKEENWLMKSSIFGYTTYTALCSSPNSNVSTLMISQSLPIKVPGLEVLESIIYPFKIKYLVDTSDTINGKQEKTEENPTSKLSSLENIFEPTSSITEDNTNSEENLIISADTDIDQLAIEKYHKDNKHFKDYPISSFKHTLVWVKKSMELYNHNFFCYPFSWIDIEGIKEIPNFGNNSLYIKYYNNTCKYVEFQEYIASISYDYLINPTNFAANEVERLNLVLNDRIRKMFGSAMILNSIKTEAHNCGQVSVDFTNGIVTFCGMVGRTKDTLIVILNFATFIGFAISIVIGIIWLISLRYESRIADSIMEMEQSSNESLGNVEQDDNVNVKINEADTNH